MTNLITLWFHAMENGPGLKMYFLLNRGIFHCYVGLPDGSQESGTGFWDTGSDPTATK